MTSHRIIITFVFVLYITAIALQIRDLAQDTWWVCDVTVEAPILNITKDSKHHIAVSIKMRTSLEETCWYVQRDEGSSAPKETFIPHPVQACLTKKLYHGRLKSKIADDIDDAKAVFHQTKLCIIFSLVFISLAATMQLANIGVCNWCLVVANIVLAVISGICTLSGVIIFSKNIGYKERYNEYDLALLPVLVGQDPTLTTEGRSLLEVLFNKLVKSNILEQKYASGTAFVLLWCSLIILSISIVVAIAGHVYAMRSNDSDYKRTPSGGSIRMPRIRFPSVGSFDMHFDDD